VERQFETIEAEGVESLLDLLGKELMQRRYRPQRLPEGGNTERGRQDAAVLDSVHP